MLKFIKLRQMPVEGKETEGVIISATEISTIAQKGGIVVFTMKNGSVFEADATLEVVEAILTGNVPKEGAV